MVADQHSDSYRNRRRYRHRSENTPADPTLHYSRIVAESALLFASSRQLEVVLAQVSQRIATLFDGVCQLRFVSLYRPVRAISIIATATRVSPVMVEHSETYAHLLREFAQRKLPRAGSPTDPKNSTGDISAVLLIAPLLSQGRRIGTIDVVMPSALEGRHSADQHLLRELAAHAALALEAADQMSALQGLEHTTTQEGQSVERDRALALIAHDLKNPLTSLRSILHLFGQRINTTANIDNRQFDHLLSLAQSALMHMEAQVNALESPRLFKLAQAGSAVTLDLVAFTRRMISLYQLTSGRHQIFLKSDPGVLLGWWERQHVERILGNLLANAIKYSPADSEILVHVAREDTESGSWAVIQIEDHGIGIPAADLLRLAQPHVRAGNVGDIPGTGMGLASVRDTVEQYGGNLSILAGCPGSTSVTIHLPLA